MSRLNDPAAAAQAWQAGLSGSRQRYIDGVNGVDRAPGQMAAEAADRWANNTIAAKPRFAANSAAVTKETWAAAAAGKGADRLASGATAAQPKVQAVFNKLFPAISQVRASLPARGDLEANIARSGDFARKMAAKKGQFKA